MTDLSLRSIFKGLLDTDCTVIVCVRGGAGVHIPVVGDCTLHYRNNLPTPIPDLAVTDEGIAATLSFGREPYATFVPWSAITAMQVRGAGVIVSAFVRPVDDQTAARSLRAI